MASDNGVSRFRPDVVVACIREAASSGKKILWTLKEDNRGVLVHLVWESSQNAFPSTESEGSKKETEANFSLQTDGEITILLPSEVGSCLLERYFKRC